MEKQKPPIMVRNAEGDPTTTAEVIIRNEINYIPKVSVIIPIYNGERYLRECLNTVVNQTLKEIEIICVDDGSTDNSLNILKEYAKKDKRITVLKQQNLYAGIARNAGLAVAKGEYLSFLDSDDFFELSMHEEMYQKAKEDDADIVVCGNNVYDEKLEKSIRQIHINKKFLKKSPFSPNLFSDCLFTSCNPNPWTKLFKRNLFTENNIYFENCMRCNDITCVYTLLAVAKKISILDKQLINYRSNQENNVSAHRKDRVDCFLYAANKLEKNLIRLNVYRIFRKAFINRISTSLKWELSACTEDQKEKIKIQAKDILPDDLYNELSDRLLFENLQKGKISNLKRFFYHKIKNDKYTKTYICNVCIKRKLNLDEYKDRLKKFYYHRTKKF